MFDSLKTRLLGRLRSFFPGAGRQQEESFARKNSGQRSFARYAVSFPVLVAGNDPANEQFEEKSRLQDVSGSGAMFITRFPDRYFPGQFLQLSILLDTAEDVQARISNEATVVRIHPQSQEASDPRPRAGVAVHFHCAFDFERTDSGHGW
ncbi:MAG: PilZ domain-containing protein [Thermodesulfobacteriota bacterium]